MKSKKQEDSIGHTLPSELVHYIAELTSKMRYRKHVRADVASELVAHFEDELRQCDTGVDRQAKALRLIGEFGEAELLAILCRRAKKRCRPLWAKGIVRSLQAIGVFAALFLVYSVWFMAGTPTINVDYLSIINQMNRPEILGEDNAWPDYEQAVALFVESPEAIRQLIGRRPEELAARYAKNRFSDGDEAKMREWIGKERSHWDELADPTRTLLHRCYAQGSVPIPGISETGRGGYAALPAAIDKFLVVHSLTASPSPVAHSPSERIDTLLARLESESATLDPNDELDAAVLMLFEAARAKQAKEQLWQAIEIGMLQAWLEDDAPWRQKNATGLLPFEGRLMRTWIAANEPAWNRFSEGAAKPYCYREYGFDPNDENDRGQLPLLNVVLPNLSGLRKLAFLGAWRCRTSAAQGDAWEALQQCLTGARAGRDILSQLTVVEQLVGAAMNGLAHQEVARVLAVHPLTVEQLRRLKEEIESIYPHGFPLINIRGEWIYFQDIVQHTFTNGGRGGGHLVPSRLMQCSSEPFDSPPAGADFEALMIPVYAGLSMIHARRDATLAKAKELFDLQVERTAMTPYQRSRSDLPDPGEFFVSEPRYRYALIEIMCPALDRASQMMYRGKITYEATLTILALQRWQMDKGAYPETLTELVDAGLLDSVPQDPFGAGALRYERVGDDFVLYSLGPNLIDDGGKVGVDRSGKPEPDRWQDNGDRVFWPLNAEPVEPTKDAQQ